VDIAQTGESGVLRQQAPRGSEVVGVAVGHREKDESNGTIYRDSCHLKEN